MKESFPTPVLEIMPVEELVALVNELHENREGFAFEGLEESAYERLRAEDEECPGYTTPIDELIKRFEAEGIKIVPGDHEGKGRAWVLPKGSDDVGQDSLSPKDLKVTDSMDPKLKQLVLNNRALKAE